MHYIRKLTLSDSLTIIAIIELKNTHFLTLSGRSDFFLKLLVDAADLSRPFAAFLLRAVSILNTILYKIRLKVLSSEMDPAESRLIRKVVLKEKGVAVFKKNPPAPHPLRAL